MRGMAYFVKFGILIAILALVSLLITDKGSPEFYLSLVAFIVGVVVAIIGALIVRKKNKDEGELL
ncbi:MAG: hypothetical protein BWY30_00502 [Tenericutes bacterium ADurb.Bin239]|nr:MAG: hypothetical protein BWY30_00502 [Tenericutes bacterium ADurb.Bin239]